jgi:hypothetical protein
MKEYLATATLSCLLIAGTTKDINYALFLWIMSVLAVMLAKLTPQPRPVQ